MFTKKIFNSIKEHAKAENPSECCGIVVNNEILKGKNISPDPTNNFEIDSSTYLKASSLGKIEAYYHSHCLESQPPHFTPFDLMISNAHNLTPILYHLPTNKFIVGGSCKYAKYLGHNFEYNTSDCLSLVENFYKNELNINFGHPFRDSNWFQISPQRIESEFKSYKFSKVNNLQYGDLIVVQYPGRNFPSHFGVYIGNDEILHHRSGGYSCIEKYSALLKGLTKFVLRYDS